MKRIVMMTVLTICFGFVTLSFAGLGDKADSVAKDRRALSAVNGNVTNRSGYSVEEMVAGSTAIREYIRSDGTVFAVTWNGYSPPDLTELLGRYSSEYSTTLKNSSHAHGRRHRQISGANVVVETWGHMRDLHGRAYVPALIPMGVTLDEIN